MEKMYQQVKGMLEQQGPIIDYSHRHQMLNAKIEIEKEILEREEMPTNMGRGGNNTAENIKKSFLAILRRRHPSLAHELTKRFIEPYALKSQKENIFLFFMFLRIFVLEGKMKSQDVETIVRELKLKIEKYISNSMRRLEGEKWRKVFHLKNVQGF